MAVPLAQGVIGPNAILQLVPVLERSGGPDMVRGLMEVAGLTTLPDGSEMIPEAQAHAMHRALRTCYPDQAATLAAEAGHRTAEYILAHRIPRPAQALLRALPAPLAAPLLSRAISAHAWTFAGSGCFRARSPWRFEIARNPVIAGERSTAPLCSWHASVFKGLYRALVAPDCHCEEIRCAAQGGSDTCTFAILRLPPRDQRDGP